MESWMERSNAGGHSASPNARRTARSLACRAPATTCVACCLRQRASAPPAPPAHAPPELLARAAPLAQPLPPAAHAELAQLPSRAPPEPHASAPAVARSAPELLPLAAPPACAGRAARRQLARCARACACCGRPPALALLPRRAEPICNHLVPSKGREEEKMA
jgi:hypothetical protein